MPSWCPGEYKSLIQRCWAADPLQRPSISELIEELKALRPEKASPGEEPLEDAAKTVNVTVTVDAAAGESCKPGQHEDAESAGAQAAEEELEGFGDELLSFFEEVRNSSTEMPAISPNVVAMRKSSRSRSCLAATLDVTDDDEEEEQEELLARESTVNLVDVLPVSKKTTAAPEDEGMAAKESKKEHKKKKKAEKKSKKASETKEERKARKAKKKEKKDKLRKPGHAKGATAVAAESRKGEYPSDAPAATVSSQAGDPPGALGGKQKATAAQPSARVRALEEKALALADTARRLQEEALELERIALEEMENEQLEQEQGQGHQADAAQESASEELPDLEAV